MNVVLYMVSCIIGIISGIITGITPGIDPNTVIFTSMPVYLSTDISQGVYISYMTGLSVSHTFHDFLPAIFISTPDAEAALSSIAAPEMVKNGKGLEAFYASVRGGMQALMVIALLLVPLYFFLEPVYQSISNYMHYILVFFLFYVISISDETTKSILISIFSGALGLLAFQSNVNQQFVLLPVFSGLFAVPSIISMLGEEFEMPEQQDCQESLLDFQRSSFAGTLAGLLAGTVPGIGPAISTSFLTPIMDKSRKSFIAAMGAVNTSDIIFSLIYLALLGRARSGVSVALQAIGKPTNSRIMMFLALSAISVILSGFLAIKVSKKYQEYIRMVELEKVLYMVSGTITVSTFLLTGFGGMLILAISSSIGMVSMKWDLRKECMMVLIIPSILSFAGISIFM